MIEVAIDRARDAVSKMLEGEIEDGESILVFWNNAWEILIVKRKTEHLHCVPSDQREFVETAITKREFVEGAIAEQRFVQNTLGNQKFLRTAMGRQMFIQAALKSDALVQAALDNPAAVQAALEEGAMVLSPKAAEALRRFHQNYDFPNYRGMNELRARVNANAEPDEEKPEKANTAGSTEEAGGSTASLSRRESLAKAAAAVKDEQRGDRP